MINQHIFKVVPGDRPKWEVEEWIDYHLARFRRIAADKAVTMGHIRRGDLTAAKVASFDDDARERLDAIAAPLDALRDAKRVEVRRLEAIRQALLPRLMSGRIRLDNDAAEPDAPADEVDDEAA